MENQQEIQLVNYELEEQIIGYLLAHGQDYDLTSILIASDFSDDFFKDCYTSMIETILDNKIVDAITILEKLKTKSYDKSCLTKINQLVESCTLERDKVESYSKTLKELSKKRKSMAIMQEVLKPEEMMSKSSTEIIEKVSNELVKIGAEDEEHIYDATACMKVFSDNMTKIKNLKDEGLIGVSTGFGMLDWATGGLEEGEEMVVAARPGIGKTSFALSMMLDMINNDKSVAYFTMEMSALQLTNKLVSIKGNIPFYKFASGYKPTTEEDEKVNKVKEQLGKKKFFIVDEPGLSTSRLRGHIRKLEKANGKKLDCLFIDYLQLMNEKGMENNLVSMTTFISKMIKTTARYFETPIVLLSQFSRAVEQERPQIPRASHLRESGSIEQDADMIIALYREDRDPTVATDKRKKPINNVEVLWLKHRNGPMKNFDLMFDDTTTGVVDPKKQPKVEDNDKPKKQMFNFD
jgi:replicative DNA helicase